jgi:hypothetical protein
MNNKYLRNFNFQFKSVIFDLLYSVGYFLCFLLLGCKLIFIKIKILENNIYSCIMVTCKHFLTLYLIHM